MIRYKRVKTPHRVKCFQKGRIQKFEYFTDYAVAREWAQQASFTYSMTMVESWTGEHWVIGFGSPPDPREVAATARRLAAANSLSTAARRDAARRRSR